MGHPGDLTLNFCYRYVAELSLCNHSIFFRVASVFFSRRLAEMMDPLPPPPPKLKLSVLPTLYNSVIHPLWFIQLQNCFDNRNVDTFTCMSKIHLGKISEICDFWLTYDFYPIFCRFKCCPLGCKFGTEKKQQFELRALV